MNEDDEDDAIAAWAQSLSPEGAPGEMSVMMRKVLGDVGYERAVAQHEALSDLHIGRQRLINKILMLIVIYGIVLGTLASVTLVAVSLRNFFG